jgi:tetratricopeptide (TPR) repeat protein
MTSNSPQPPDLDRVEKGIKALTDLASGLTGLLRLVAGMIRKRQWVDLLMFAIAVSIIFIGTKFTLAQFVKEPIFYGVWMGLGVIFLVGLVLELRKRPAFKTIVPGKRKAIKFLSSFELEDAEIYGRLQGYRDLGLILENIILPDFSFGVLKGRSGCGKSSYLKAGLLAALAKTEAYRGVYIKFSNLDPLVTIREAVVETLKLPKAEVESLGLIELLNQGVGAASEGSPSFKSLILIFDQFEQFFVYTDDVERRSQFIQALASWYSNDELKKKVKILVSIRGDWFDRMDEIQAVLGYPSRIGGHMGGNSFRLKNFSAEEATMILGVMAQEDLGIEAEDTVRFDRGYIQEVLERELASPTDHLISPVDLQIIAEMIKQQNIAELRSFNRTALQRLGGIEGLRRSFLESILEPLGPERKRSAVQVMVALTNLEQQTRAELQTLEQLQKKVKEAMQPQEVVKIADYLQGAALIAVVERGGVKGYELSHEGMIGAVIRLGEKVQDKVYRANQLLERRVNEWLGNNRSSRYLFNLVELWSLESQKSYLIWGVKQQQKIKLIDKSKQQIYRTFGGFGGILFLGIGVWSFWNYTPWGQLTQIRWRLADVGQKISDPSFKSQAAVAFAKDKNFGQAFKLVNQIQDSSDKASALISIAEVMINLNQSIEAAPLLEKAIVSANQIQDSSNKARVLGSIAETIGNFKQSIEAAPLLEKAIVSANQIQDSSNKARVLGSIAETIGNFKQPEKAIPLLEKAIVSANQIQNSSNKARVLGSIAETIGNFKQPEKAIPLLEKVITITNKIQAPSKNYALRNIAEAYGNLKQPEKATPLLEKAITTANKIQGSFYKTTALYKIAETVSKLKQPERAMKLLEMALTTIDKIQDSSDKASALISIAEVYSTLKQTKNAAPLLEQAITSANQIQDSYGKAYVLISIAEVYSTLKQTKNAAPLLEQAITSANQIQDSHGKAYVLRSISEASAKLNQLRRALPVFKKEYISANQIQDSDLRTNVLCTIAEAIGKFNQLEKTATSLETVINSNNRCFLKKVEALVTIPEARLGLGGEAPALVAIAREKANQYNWGQAFAITQQCPSKDCEVESLSKILTVYAEQQHPELKEEEKK